MKHVWFVNWIAGFFSLCLPLMVSAGATVTAVKLNYREMEQGIVPYNVSYTVTDQYIRIDDESDNSGYILFNMAQQQVYSISHDSQTILVIPQYPLKALQADFDIKLDYKPIENAPKISGKDVYNYRVTATTGTGGETCMEIQLVPGLLPEVAKSLQAFQQVLSGQQIMNLDGTPDEFRTPCFLVDLVFNKGDYYHKGFPIQEWHSNEKMRQLMDYTNVEVDSALFDIPDAYRQYSLHDEAVEQ